MPANVIRTNAGKRRSGGGNSGALVQAIMAIAGNYGGAAVSPDTSEALKGQQIREGTAKAASYNEAVAANTADQAGKKPIKWKPKSGFLNVLSGGQGSKLANELNTQQILDAIAGEQAFNAMVSESKFKDPREVVKAKGLVPTKENISKYDAETATPTIASIKEGKLADAEKSADERGETELRARKRGMTSDNQIQEAAFEAFRKKELAKSAAETVGTEASNIKAKQEAEPYFLNTKKNEAALVNTPAGTYDVNTGRVVVSKPKSGDSAIADAMKSLSGDSKLKPIVPKDQIEWDIVMIEGKPVKVPKRKPAAPKNY